MKKRIFGRKTWKVSEVGFGGWGIGRNWWGHVNDNESLEALQVAYENGINFFDSAYVYGDGHSEKLIGNVLKNKDAYLATKIPPKNDCWPAKPEHSIEDVFPSSWIESCTERSLKNLQRESIDLTQFHVWTDAWIDRDSWKESVVKLKKSGKIKAFGVSINDHAPNSALKLVSSGLVDSVQVIFNIFDQSPLEQLFPLCEKHNVAVIVRVPFDEGGLTGTLTEKTVFEEGDFRKSYFRGENLKNTVERADALKSFLTPEIPTLADLALKFILSFQAVSVVIPGMRRKGHVEKNIKASAQTPLSSDLLVELKKHAWRKNFYGWWDK